VQARKAARISRCSRSCSIVFRLVARACGRFRPPGASGGRATPADEASRWLSNCWRKPRPGCLLAAGQRWWLRSAYLGGRQGTEFGCGRRVGRLCPVACLRTEPQGHLRRRKRYPPLHGSRCARLRPSRHQPHRPGVDAQCRAGDFLRHVRQRQGSGARHSHRRRRRHPDLGLRSVDRRALHSDGGRRQAGQLRHPALPDRRSLGNRRGSIRRPHSGRRC
jgi:hypothetical protein